MYANFMVYAACIPVLLEAWRMTATQAGSIASAFMAAYAVSLFVSSWLADHFGAKRVFLASAYCSVVTALLFGLFARSYFSGLFFYALAAVTQGGMYTPVIMLLSDRYKVNRRGTAMGHLIASTSIGYAFSLIVAGVCLALGSYRTAFVITGCLPILGALLIRGVLRDTENIVHERTEHVNVVQIFRRNHNARYLTAGYTFHCWELLGMWSWTPAFFAASFALTGGDFAETAKLGAYLTAAMHIVGSLASSSMGKLSDSLGRRTVLISVAVMSAVTSFTIGWLISVPIVLLMLIGLFYYFTAIGDSPVLSTAISEQVEPGYLGTVLAVRALLGFGVGAVSPIVFGVVLDIANGASSTVSGWGWAFMTLGIGGWMAAYYAWRYRPAV